MGSGKREWASTHLSRYHGRICPSLVIRVGGIPRSDSRQAGAADSTPYSPICISTSLPFSLFRSHRAVYPAPVFESPCEPTARRRAISSRRCILNIIEVPELGCKTQWSIAYEPACNYEEVIGNSIINEKILPAFDAPLDNNIPCCISLWYLILIREHGLKFFSSFEPPAASQCWEILQKPALRWILEISRNLQSFLRIVHVTILLEVLPPNKKFTPQVKDSRNAWTYSNKYLPTGIVTQLSIENKEMSSLYLGIHTMGSL